MLKPSELTPGPAVGLIRLLAGLPLPAGTVNLVLGTGREVGPGFPALWRYRLRTQGGWQGQRFAGAENLLLDEARINDGTRIDCLVDQAL